MSHSSHVMFEEINTGDIFFMIGKGRFVPPMKKKKREAHWRCQHPSTKKRWLGVNFWNLKIAYSTRTQRNKGSDASVWKNNTL